MKAIILAAGRGSRMGESTQDIPKGLVKLFGKSLLEQQISKMKEAGIEDIGVIRGYMSEKIDFEGISYFDNTKWSESNMVTSLCCANTWLSTEECVVSYSDILYEATAITLLKNCKEDIAITYSTNWLDLWSSRFEDPLSDAETFETDTNSYLKEIGGRAEKINQIQGQYMGLLKFTPEGWKKAKEYLDKFDESIVNKLDMTTLLSNLLKERIKIYGIPYDGLWLEVDSENDRRLYEKKYPNLH